MTPSTRPQRESSEAALGGGVATLRVPAAGYRTASGASFGARIAIPVSLGLLLVVAAIASYCGAALTWDGASLFFSVLDGQRFEVPHGRFSVALFELPVLLAAKLTSQVRILELVYGATYACVPLAAAWCCWRIVRTVRPRLILWPLLWICLGAMPGQLFFVTECIIAIHCSWPLLLVVGTGFSRRRWLLFLLLCPFLFFLHPISGPLFVGFSVLGFACAWKKPTGGGQLLAAALLAVLGVLRAVVTWRDAYERSAVRTPWGPIWRELRLPVTGLLAIVALVAVIAGIHRLAPASRRHALRIAFGAVGIAAASFVLWVLDSPRWQNALHYRLMAPIAAVPFFVAASTAILRDPRARGDLRRGEGWLAMSAAGAYALVLGIQCVVWFHMRLALERQLVELPSCVPVLSLPLCRDSALRWWPTPSYALIIQGRAPRRLLLHDGNCLRRDFDRSLVLTPFPGARPRDVGWFDLRKIGLAPALGVSAP